MPTLYNICEKWGVDPAIALGVNWIRVMLRKSSLAEYECMRNLTDKDILKEALIFQSPGGKLDVNYATLVAREDFLPRFHKFKMGFYWKMYKTHFSDISLYGSIVKHD